MKFIWYFFLFFIYLFSNCPVKSEDSPVKIRVGIYQNKPLVFQTESGEPQGLYVDLLNQIASRSNWQLEYNLDSFSNLIKYLKNDKIDLLTCIAPTKQRNNDFEFSKEAVFVLWGVVYVSSDSKVETIIDLNGKKIAIMQKGIFGRKLKKLCDEFSIKCFFTETNSQHESLELLKLKKVDAATFNNAFREVYHTSNLIKKTSIIFSPLKIFFATQKHKNNEILKTIDADLKNMKASIGSLYYDSLNKWTNALEVLKPYVPKWLGYSFILFLVILACSLIWTFILLFQIRKRKKVEDALQKSEILHREAQNVARIGHWELASPADTPVWSEQIFRIFGLDPDKDAPSFAEHQNIIHHEDWPLLDKSITLLSKKGTSFDIEFRILRSDGKCAWMHARGSTKNADRSIKRLFGTAQDITGRKDAEFALQKERDTAQRYLDIAGTIFVAIDTNGTVTLINRKGCDVLCYNHEDVIGKNWFENFIPKWLRENLILVSEQLLRGEVLPVEYYENPILTRTGEERLIAWHNTILHDDEGKIIGHLSSGEDITEKNRIEGQLQQAQKIEAIGTLAGGIAHDFNNMLGVITGNVSYALSQFNQDEELTEVLSDIQGGAKQAQKLTQQLLTFAKGGTPIKKAVDIKIVIKESAKFVTRGSKAICNFDFADDLWIVEVDEGQINQAISNLVINANQAMPNGGKIFIRTENIYIESESNHPLPTGRYIKIIIEDMGIGISKKNFSNIFDPYFSTKQKGSGLGLATTYSIIKRHGGHISVESKLDEGSTFLIYIPVSDKDVEKVVEKEKFKHTGHGKILVVDDEEHILKMVGRILNEMGYEPYFAEDGEQAINMYQTELQCQQPFVFVILDLTIPGGIGGQETIKELLKIDPNVKAVVSSGYSNDPVMSNFKDHGFCGVIPKPYTKDLLAEILNKIFDKND